MIKIESQTAITTFETHAAQITSFKKKDSDFEYMYQPQEPFWTGRNPTLFPLVGGTTDKILHIDGKDYTTGNHGFARNSEFKVVSQKENQVTFLLQENEETLAQYPYQFDLEITYTIIDSMLEVHYEIRNRSDKMMPFTFGLHPAFAVPYPTSNSLDELVLEFTNQEKQILALPELNAKDGRIIPLNEKFFNEVKTLLFENCESSYVTLTDGKHGVKVSMAGYRYIAFWKQPDSPFVCIEPWHGRGDRPTGETSVEFKDRPCMIHLDPNRQYTTEYTINIF